MPLVTPPTIPRFSGKTEADRYFLELALAERSVSDDPKSKLVLQSGVGALIVRGTDIIARSANVLPPRLKEVHTEQDKTISEEERYHFVEHAERSAIYSALLSQQNLSGATIYCSRFACSDCARAIVWAGISKAVFATGYGAEQRWQVSQRAAADILRLSGVTVRILTVD